MSSFFSKSKGSNNGSSSSQRNAHAPPPAAAANFEDDSDADTYLKEPTEIPPPPQQRQQHNSTEMQAMSPRTRISKRHVIQVIDTGTPDAELDRRYDLTPLGQKDTNSRNRPPSYSIDPWENNGAKELARMEKEQEAAQILDV